MQALARPYSRWLAPLRLVSFAAAWQRLRAQLHRQRMPHRLPCRLPQQVAGSSLDITAPYRGQLR
jgi:hypothetical protein